MRILVLGAAGFVGTALCRTLSGRGHDVFAADRQGTPLYFELSDPESADAVIQQSSPDAAVLLSGASSVGASWRNPSETFTLNTAGALNVFESCLKFAPDARFIFAGSAEEYGRSCHNAAPFKEDDLCTPANPYALSKYSAAQTMHMLARKNGSQFVHLRLANHFGPGQRKGFAAADFASQIADKIKANDTSDIEVGNLEAERDFLYIDDVIDAYTKIIEADNLQYDTYNIGSGNPVSIKTLLETLLKTSGIKSNIRTVAEKMRSVDIKTLSLDASRIKGELNWHPVTDLESALEKTLDYWCNL